MKEIYNRLEKVLLFDPSPKKTTLFMLVNNGYLAILHYRKNKSGKVTV